MSAPEPAASASSFQVGTRRRGHDGRLWEVDFWWEGANNSQSSQRRKRGYEKKFWVAVAGSGPQPNAQDEMDIVTNFTEVKQRKSTSHHARCQPLTHVQSVLLRC